uniref:Uncharacterized protein n=1 Tax=Panagrolaimus sp. JU765 TaxID=591449 RepID=A0AC34QCV2_9BILA
MRLYIVIPAIFLIFSISGTVGDELDPVVNKITNLLSPFLTKAQLKTVLNKVFDLAWSGQTPEQIKSQILSIGMSTVNAQQKAKVMQVYQGISNELGGSAKAEALLNVLMNKLTAVLNPYINQMQTTIKNKKSAGKAAAKTAILKQGANFLTSANIQKAVNQVKAAFTQKQCDVAFKYLAPTYLKLGLYKFKSSKCTGTGN